MTKLSDLKVGDQFTMTGRVMNKTKEWAVVQLDGRSTHRTVPYIFMRMGTLM